MKEGKTSDTVKDFKLCFNSLGFLVQKITSLIQTNKSYRVTIVEWRESRSLNMNAFQHVIYSDISKFLIKKGRSDWNKEYTKECLKNTYLGWEDKVHTNVVTGEKTTSSALRRTRDLDQGEAYHYTTQLLDFAQGIGCEIKIPSKCEYRNLTWEQLR